MEDIMKVLSEIESNKSVIPESCLSYSEMADYTIEEAMKSYVRLCTITEKADKVSTKEAFRSHLTSVWSNNKAFYEKALKDAKIKKSKATNIKLTASNLANIESKVYGKCHAYKEEINFSNNAIKFAREVNRRFTALSIDDDATELKATKKKLERELCASISGDSSVASTKQLKRVIYKKLTGPAYKADTAFVKRHITQMTNVINDGTISTIKKAYNAEKKLTGSIMAFISKIDTDSVYIANGWASLLTNILVVAHKAYAIELDVAARQYSEYYTVLAKASKDAKKSVKEAADVTDAPEELTMEADQKLVADPGTDCLPNMKGSLDELDDKKFESPEGPKDKGTDNPPDPEPIKNKEDATIKEETEVIEEKVKLPKEMKITDEDFWNSGAFKTKFKKIVEYYISNGAKDKELAKFCYEAYFGNIGSYFVNTDYSKKYAPKLAFLADYINKYPKYKNQIIKDANDTLKVEGKVSKRVPEDQRQAFLKYQAVYMADLKAMLAKLQ